MTESKQKIARESLERAVNNQSIANYDIIINGFIEMGIDANDITPRVNVFTFNAWKALGRTVKKGEKGVRIITCIPCTKKDKETGEEIQVTKTKSTTVFHISQTKLIDEKDEDNNTPAEAAELEERRQHYAERLEAKRDRLGNCALKARTKGHSLHEKAHSMAESIPFGQPILIGHHSEKRDRRFRGRIHDTFGKAFAELDKADYYQERAAKVGTGGISSDDPDAIQKLTEKLEKMQANQELMKACNKIIKKYQDQETQVIELVKLGLKDESARQLVKGDHCGNVGFARYALSNNNANMSTVKERIETLKKVRDISKEAEPEKYDSFTYRVDDFENRIMFIFDGKPEEEIRKLLSSNAFKYSPTRNAWVRKTTLNALHSARYVKDALIKLEKGV